MTTDSGSFDSLRIVHCSSFVFSSISTRTWRKFATPESEPFSSMHGLMRTYAPRLSSFVHMALMGGVKWFLIHSSRLRNVPLEFGLPRPSSSQMMSLQMQTISSGSKQAFRKSLVVNGAGGSGTDWIFCTTNLPVVETGVPLCADRSHPFGLSCVTVIA